MQATNPAQSSTLTAILMAGCAVLVPVLFFVVLIKAPALIALLIVLLILTAPFLFHLLLVVFLIVAVAYMVRHW
jgi:hypothetical protein